MHNMFLIAERGLWVYGKTISYAFIFIFVMDFWKCIRPGPWPLLDLSNFAAAIKTKKKKEKKKIKKKKETNLLKFHTLKIEK